MTQKKPPAPKEEPVITPEMEALALKLTTMFHELGGPEEVEEQQQKQSRTRKTKSAKRLPRR